MFRDTVHQINSTSDKAMICSKTFTTDCNMKTAFEYLSDFSNCQQWDTSVRTATKTSNGRPKIGSQFSVTVQFGISKINIDYELKLLEENQKLVFEGASQYFHVIDEIFFSALPEEQCKIHYCATVTYTNFLSYFTPIINPFFQKMGTKAIQQLQDTLYSASVNTRHQAELPQPEQSDDDKSASTTPKIPGTVTIKLANKITDATLLPGLLKFTRLGHALMHRQQQGVLADLSGRVIVITGGTSGIGKATVLALQKMNAEIVVVSRTESKALALQAWLKCETGSTCNIELADMSLQEEVRLLINRLQAKYAKIDVLINNAGELINTQAQTKEGLEKSFATLLLGPFTLTEGLLPQLTAAKTARVINVSSGGMYAQATKIKDLNFRRGRYNGAVAYARAKRGLVDMTQYWARRHADSGIVFHAMHPGWVDTPGVVKALPTFYKLTKPFLRTPEEGADTVVWLAAAKAARETTGGFWLDRECHPTAVLPLTRTSATDQAALAEQLRHYAKNHLQEHILTANDF